MQERKVPFKEVDVTKGPAAAQELQRKSGQTGVPVIIVNGTVIVGFDRPKLVRALGVRD
ncbi:MAG: NrdH-redoxin [Firmicutes bacterium]|nr:NrdH-redoxin [Bacillota bacterium]